MTRPVVFFDIGCRDKEKTAAFYSKLFGWEMSPVNPFSDGFETGEGGIRGAITALGHEPHNYVMVYTEVDDLEASIEQCRELGGELLIGPLPTPDGKRFAWAKDPEGTLFGILGPAVES